MATLDARSSLNCHVTSTKKKLSQKKEKKLAVWIATLQVALKNCRKKEKKLAVWIATLQVPKKNCRKKKKKN